MISINNVRNLEIRLQSKGHEDHVGENILLNIGFIGWTINSSNTQYRLNIDGIIQEIASAGIRFI